MKLPKLNAHSRAFQYFILPKSFLGQYTRAYTQFIRHTGRRMNTPRLSKVFTRSGGRGTQCESVLWHVTCGPLYMQTTVYTHSYFSQDVSKETIA
jgi:hypothetical protein